MDRQTDGQRWTNQLTDRPRCRFACTRLKTETKRLGQPHFLTILNECNIFSTYSQSYSFMRSLWAALTAPMSKCNWSGGMTKMMDVEPSSFSRVKWITFASLCILAGVFEIPTQRYELFVSFPHVTKHMGFARLHQTTTFAVDACKFSSMGL